MKHHGSSTKAWNNGNTSGAQSKQSGKGQNAVSKKESQTKQVDLKAKFASLLKQSKDLQKERDTLIKHASATQLAYSGKQDKKGEKRDAASAAAARNQLFGENQKSSTK